MRSNDLTLTRMKRERKNVTSTIMIIVKAHPHHNSKIIILSVKMNQNRQHIIKNNCKRILTHPRIPHNKRTKKTHYNTHKSQKIPNYNHCNRTQINKRKKKRTKVLIILSKESESYKKISRWDSINIKTQNPMKTFSKFLKGSNSNNINSSYYKLLKIREKLFLLKSSPLCRLRREK